nr:uncharacterized protein LOC133603061 [Nerophis lumbriciformis]
MKTLPELSADLSSGEVTSAALVGAYLERIEQVDRSGPALQSVLIVNPHALREARLLDAKRNKGYELGPLHGIPILLKDNIESSDQMATTAGSTALAQNVTGRDSPLVAGLRAAGVVILGKTNLSQWANFRSERSISGWSSMGGQVRNPHMLDRSPCGSSSGSAVAVAASLTAGAVAIHRTDQFFARHGRADDKNSRWCRADVRCDGYHGAGDKLRRSTRRLDPRWRPRRCLRFAEGSNPDIVARFNEALAVLATAGAELVEIEQFAGRDSTFYDSSYEVLKYEFKATLNDYLASLPINVKSRSLNDLIAFNQRHRERELVLFDQSIFVESAAYPPLTDDTYLAALASVRQTTRDNGIDALLKRHRAQVLVSPSGPVASRVDPINGDVWPDWAGAGGIAAVAGYPHLSVPMGSVHGVPLGLSFFAGANDDAAVLSFGYAFEQRTQHRVEPRYLVMPNRLKSYARR